MKPSVTDLLQRAQSGESLAWEVLYQRVYDELRRVARQQLWRQPGATLHTTELVHETYLKLLGRTEEKIQNRAHFFALASRAMRQVLVDHFRHRRALKRGGASSPLTLQEGAVPIDDRGEAILAVDEVLSRLSELDERLGRVVEYKFFGGMTEPEIGEVLGLSERTVRSDWRKARAWLARELGA